MPPISELLVAAMLLCSGAVVMIAALGLHQLPDFFARMHAPALASTLGVWIVAAASIIHFSDRAGQLRLHIWLIVVVLSISAPVTTVVLARAALFRRRRAGDPLPAPLRQRGGASARAEDAPPTSD